MDKNYVHIVFRRFNETSSYVYGWCVRMRLKLA